MNHHLEKLLQIFEIDGHKPIPAVEEAKKHPLQIEAAN